MNQPLSKVIPVVSATALVVGVCPFNVAAATALSKEEVVYVNLAQDGSVENIYVVNAFDADQETSLVDYGVYSDIQNLSTTDTLQLSDDKINLEEIKGRFYYQGNLVSTDIPWIIKIQYLLNGEEVQPKELAGQSGNVEIKLSAQQNENVDPVFYENFSLQATFLFESDSISNIEAEGATIANVGSQKQLVFNLLASGDKEINIKLESTNFSMEGIQINGIPLTLKVDKPDTSEFTDRITELQDGVVQLDDGATELSDGAKTLQSGASDLKNGASSLQQGSISIRDGVFGLADGSQRLYTGVFSLKEGLTQFNSGAVTLHKGFETLVGQSSSLTDGSQKVVDALSTLDSGSQSLASGVNELVNQLGPLNTNLDDLNTGAQAISGGLGQLQSSSVSLVEASKQLEEGLTQGSEALNYVIATSNSDGMQNVLSTLSQSDDPAVLTLVQAYTAQQVALGQISEGFSTLDANYHQFQDGLVGLSSGIETVQTSYSQVQGGISTIVTAFGTLTVENGPLMNLQQGGNELANGLTQLHHEYQSLHDGIVAYTQGTKQLSTGFNSLKEGLNELVGGSESLYSGASSLVDGTTQLKDGSETLASGTTTLYQGTVELMDGVSELSEGSVELVNGTNEMRDQTANLDEEIDTKIDEMMTEILGDEFEIKSFVSDKNTDVSAVQFIMKTDGISIDDETEKVVEEEVELNFWQKLLNLFGWEN